MTLTQPLKWHGGKHYLAKHIIALMPKHLHYVEPYFGGGSVLLQKPYLGTSEVVNDINSELTNFWVVLRDGQTFERFKLLVEATPFSAVEFMEAGRMHQHSVNYTPVSRAWQFFVRARQSRQGLMKDFATLSRNRIRRGMNEQVSSWLTAIEGLPAVHDRLKRVVIFNKDALEVIHQQDGQSTLFYCDPTYLHETRVTTSDYEYEMTLEQHGILLYTLSHIKGKFILSGYPSKMYIEAEELAGWHRKDILIDNKASSKKEKDLKTECLWYNF